MPKISKITISPSRTLSLGQYESVKLSASVEVELDEPTDNPEKIKEAFEMGRKYVREEFVKQYEPYKKVIDAQKKS